MSKRVIRERPARGAVVSRRAVAGPGAPKGQHVTITWEQRRDRAQPRLLICIGRGLDSHVGVPPAYEVARAGVRLLLIPTEEGEGYRPNRSGVPRFHADGLRDVLGHLPAGAYPAQVRDGMIVATLVQAPRPPSPPRPEANADIE